MKKTNVIGWLVLAHILAGSSHAAPLWEFKFNETGTICTNTGTSPTSMTTKQDFYGSASDLHGAAGSGVSGLAGDRALNLSGINYTGGTFPGMSHTPYLDIPNASCAAIQTLQTFTLSGWFNSQSIISNTPAYGNTGTLIDFSSYQKGFGVQFNTDNSSTIKLCAQVNATKGYFDVSSVMAFNSTNKWFFWAVTYDGTQTGSNLKLYMGTTNSSVTLVGTQSANQGTIVTEGNDFGFNLASSGGGNTLKSFMDDIRIDNTVLAQSDLETRRKQDANIISAPTVDNAGGATAVLTTSATLNGTLSAGTLANVYIYWWQDGSATTNLIDFGAPILQGAFATNLTGLAISTKYWYTCFASNSIGTAWAVTATNFTTLAALRPTITNAAATNVLNTGACLNGYLTSTGTALASVWVGLEQIK